MITIGLDLGSAPSVLAALGNSGNAQRIANAAAESYNADIHDWIDAGAAFAPHTGQLQQSINWRPGGNGTAEIYANAEYAAYVEDGTRPRVIPPLNRQALRFPVSGGEGFGFARAINHPGSQAFPFFFADQDARERRMQERSLSVLAQIMADAGGVSG